MVQLDYKIEQEVYTGPFDLLLKAIDHNEIDIFNVSISQIVDSYFAYWRTEKQDLLHASDFLIMAALLLELKSKQLLPKKEELILEEELGDIEGSLLSHIQEYEIYRNLAQTLKERKNVFEKVYGRHEGEKMEKEIELKDVSLQDLVVAFKKAYDQASQRSRFSMIEEEEITLEQRVEEVKHLVTVNPNGIPLVDIFTRGSRIEIVVTFLAMLELAKQHFLRIVQGGRFEQITIIKRKETDDGTRATATGSELGPDQDNS